MKLLSTMRRAVAGAFTGFAGAFGSYNEITAPSADRGRIMYYLPQDGRQYVTCWTRREILRKVEWLLQTFGVMKEGVRGMARFTVGKGICLQINSTDEAFNEAAGDDFECYAMSADRFDRSGRRNFYEAQFHAIVQRIKTGEFLGSFAENPRWEKAPCVQFWDSTEIETPESANDDPMVVDGIRLDADHCPTAYYARTLGGSSKAIPAGAMMHWFFADATNQVRGVSELAQAINPMMDTKELIQITTKSAKLGTSVGMHVKKMLKAGGQGAIGKLKTLYGATPGAAGAAPSSTPAEPEPQYESVIGGGAVIYTDTDGDVKLLTPQTPTPLLEPFIKNVLLRNAFCSLGIPAEVFWSCSDLNGANQRFILLRAENAFDALGDGLIGRFCSPVATRYLLHRIETGALPPCKDPNWLNKMEWQRPARLTVDRADRQIDLQELAAGASTLRDINDKRGRGWREPTDQWFREFAYAAACAKRHGVEWALKLWRAGMPGAGMAAPEDPNADPAEEKKPGELPPGNDPKKPADPADD